MRAIVLALAALLCVPCFAATPAAAAACRESPVTAPALARLRAALAHARFVAYEPTGLTVTGEGRISAASEASIRGDLAVLRKHFDALVTYDAIHGAENIPAVAASLGYQAVIVGVWNPLVAGEVEAASDAARRYPHLVAGIALGNELIFTHRAEVPALVRTIAQLHERLPKVPLTTTEPFHTYRESAGGLLPELDFLLVNVHPIFQPWFREAPDSTRAQFLVNVVTELNGSYCGPILVKETGVPSAPAGAGFTEERQASFYLELARRFPSSPERAFAYFAAFDAPWRESDASTVPHPEEAHWGLYTVARRAKSVVGTIPTLSAGRVPP